MCYYSVPFIFLSSVYFSSLSSPRGLSPRTLPQDYLPWWLLAVHSPPGRAADPVSAVLPAAIEPWPATLSRTCYLVQDLLFDPLSPSLPHLLSWPPNAQLWKVKWHLLLRCRSVAPLWLLFDPASHLWIFEHLKIMIWPQRPCTHIISTWQSQKRTGLPSEPGSSLGFFLRFPVRSPEPFHGPPVEYDWHGD